MKTVRKILTGCALALALPIPITLASNGFLDEDWSSSSADFTPSVKPSSDPTQATGKMVPAFRNLPPDPTTGQQYRIGPHDLLRVEVFQVPELSSKERVNDEGNIVLPLIGALGVGGLTPEEAEAVIAEQLGRDYLQDPHVDIDIVESASQQVTVMGAVNKPGVFPISGQTTLLQAIAMAQGVNTVAEEEEVIVFRADSNGNMQAYVIDLEKVQEGKLGDPVIVGNDRLVVPESGGEVFLRGVATTLRGFVRFPMF